MIRKVVLKGFKRFAQTEITLPGHIVLAGPNNTGKTTLLQAIAAWELGFRKWRELGNFNPRRNGYSWQELERLAFAPVAVRSFELLWSNRERQEPLEIGLQVEGLPLVTLEFRYHSAGSMDVRPKSDVTGDILRDSRLGFHTTFIPAMSGLARTEQRLADPEAIDAALAQGRPGEVLRNLLFMAHQDDAGWRRLNATVRRLFSCQLEPPRSGAELICEYSQGMTEAAPRFDVASAGSGFLQVLLLLTLLLTQSRSAAARHRVLLIDEPDAHLHLLLQRSIYSDLKHLVAGGNAQLLVATHSEMIVNYAESHELCLMFGTPRLASEELKKIAKDALGVVTHSELLEAEGALGVLYTEDFTDVDVLKAFAQVLGDERALRLLSREIVLKSSRAPLPEGLGEYSPQLHWGMLKLVRDTLPALELLDGDSKNRADDAITGAADRMQRLRWRRYEIESYLIHPAALVRFVLARHGPSPLADESSRALIDDLRDKLQQAFVDDPLHPVPLVETFFRAEPVSKTLLPGLLQAAGLNNVPKREYFEIAAQFRPEEVHSEIKERLGQIKQAFGVADV